MDPRHFDALTRLLSARDSRRRLLALLAAVPVVGGLLSILSPEETEAAGRRKRRKKAHKHGKGRRRKHKKKPSRCASDSVAQTCAGRCGTVQNNCNQPVDCGSCACTPACGVCFTCQDGPNTPGTCVVDPTQQGQACGTGGQVCQGDGTCACDASSCAAGQVCEEGACRCTPASCPDGCCDGAVCRGRDDTACGRGGGACAACVAPATCQQGVCSLYPTYGCTLQDDVCTGSGNRFCPDNPGVLNPPFSFGNLCLIAASGYPVCSPRGIQATCTADAQCTTPGFPVCVAAQPDCLNACREIATPPV